ncbi:hypothetical protein JXR93_05845 [bacterium]|nr:hypothetical protein [bacterium]
MKKIIFLLLTLALSFNIFGGSSTRFVIKTVDSEKKLELSKRVIENFTKFLKDEGFQVTTEDKFIEKYKVYQEKIKSCTDYRCFAKNSIDISNSILLTFKFRDDKSYIDIKTEKLYESGFISQSFKENEIDIFQKKLLKNIFGEAYKERPSWISKTKDGFYTNDNGKKVIRVVSSSEYVGDLDMTCNEAYSSSLSKISFLVKSNVKATKTENGETREVSTKMKLSGVYVADKWVSMGSDCYFLVEVAVDDIIKVNPDINLEHLK